MTILDILTVPNPILKQECDPVTVFDKHLSKLVDDMFVTMRDHKGIGLAAPQIGILQKIVICEFEEDKLIMINPTIISKEEEIISQEGCLSIPNKLYDVTRFQKVTVNALDISGNPFSISRDNLMSIIIQHELDHLKGILITEIGNEIIASNDLDENNEVSQ